MLDAAVFLLSIGVACLLSAIEYRSVVASLRAKDPEWDKRDLRNRSRDWGGHVQGRLIGANLIGPYFLPAGRVCLGLGTLALLAWRLS